MKLILVVALLFLIVVPVLFVCHKVYQDGIFGRIGLLGVSALALFILLEMYFGSNGRYDYLIRDFPEVTWMIISFAVFTSWHLCRFERRVLKEKRKRELEPILPERRRHHELQA